MSSVMIWTANWVKWYRVLRCRKGFGLLTPFALACGASLENLDIRTSVIETPAESMPSRLDSVTDKNHS